MTYWRMLLKIMNEKDIAIILTKRLIKLGFVVHRYDAYSTDSIYLKLDFGVCCGIRISNHIGKKKYHYRFNVIKDYKGDKSTHFENLVSYFFNYTELPQLIKKVIEEKETKIKRYGLDNYKKYMNNEANNELFNRFKKAS